jgi:hypothetical protein
MNTRAVTSHNSAVSHSLQCLMAALQRVVKLQKLPFVGQLGAMNSSVCAFVCRAVHVGELRPKGTKVHCTTHCTTTMRVDILCMQKLPVTDTGHNLHQSTATA